MLGLTWDRVPRESRHTGTPRSVTHTHGIAPFVSLVESDHFYAACRAGAEGLVGEAIANGLYVYTEPQDSRTYEPFIAPGITFVDTGGEFVQATVDCEI